jgi:thymidylate synthase (FAD)
MIQLLDHGYVKLIKVYGTDESIIEAARMSTDGGFVSWEPYEDHPKGDLGLLTHLWKNRHYTPFEMAGMIIEVQAPIMVFREWHRHRTQSYNEMSGRYVVLPDLYYIPSIERLMAGKQSTKNKQGSTEGISEEKAREMQELITYSTECSRVNYDILINAGLSKELSRTILPVNQYSRMRASANLRNWLAFLDLRMAPNAQWEIRQYANVVARLIEDLFPRTYALFSG